MRADNTERNSHRMQLAAGAVLIVLAVILGISGFLQQRDVDRETGNAHGYATGYCIGYADRLNGMQQDAQKLAGEMCPMKSEPESGNILSWGLMSDIQMVFQERRYGV